MGKATLEQGWVGGGSSLESRIQSWPMRTSICRRKKLLLPFQGRNSTAKRQQWSEQRCQRGNHCSHGRKNKYKGGESPESSACQQQPGLRFTVQNTDVIFTQAWSLWEDVVQDFVLILTEQTSSSSGQNKGCFHWPCLPTLHRSTLLACKPSEGFSLGTATSVCGKTFLSS